MKIPFLTGVVVIFNLMGNSVKKKVKTPSFCASSSLYFILHPSSSFTSTRRHIQLLCVLSQKFDIKLKYYKNIKKYIVIFNLVTTHINFVCGTCYPYFDKENPYKKIEIVLKINLYMNYNSLLNSFAMFK